jgi:hypothetical protein
MSRNNNAGARSPRPVPGYTIQGGVTPPLRKIGRYLVIGLQALMVLAAAWLIGIGIYSICQIYGGAQ